MTCGIELSRVAGAPGASIVHAALHALSAVKPYLCARLYSPPPLSAPRQVQQRVRTRLDARQRRETEEARIAAAVAAEEQKFEAIKARFGLDAAGIIDALSLWQEHGDDIAAWRGAQHAAHPGANGARPPPRQLITCVPLG